MRPPLAATRAVPRAYLLQRIHDTQEIVAHDRGACETSLTDVGEALRWPKIAGSAGSKKATAPCEFALVQIGPLAGGIGDSSAATHGCCGLLRCAKGVSCMCKGTARFRSRLAGRHEQPHAAKRADMRASLRGSCCSQCGQGCPSALTWCASNSCGCAVRQEPHHRKLQEVSNSFRAFVRGP